MESPSVDLDAESCHAVTKRGDQTSMVRNFTSVSGAEYTLVPNMSAGRKHRCLISVMEPLHMRWDLFILVLAIWNCFYVPFMVAFSSKEEYPPLVAVDILVDFAYLLDILVCARSTYLDLNTGEEVTDWLLILKHYFNSGKLFLDVMSAIPFDIVTFLFASRDELQLLTLMKVVRLLRLSKIIMFMQSKHHVKLKLKLLQLLFISITYLHLQACFWFMLTSIEDEYIPPALYIDKEASLFTEHVWRQYAYSLYMSVYMLTAAEIGPRTEFERIFAGCAIILGQLFQAYMFGEIAVVLFNLNFKAERITSIQDAATTTMVNMMLDERLRSKISAFLVAAQGSVTKQTEYEEFFKVLPPSLKQEVRSLTFEHVMVLNPTLSNHSQLMTSFLHRLSNLYCQPEQKIIVQGGVADALYFVISGKLAVHVLDEFKQPHTVKYLTTGSHFGEIALVFPTPRTATVMTVDYSTLAVLSKDDFIALCRRYPKAKTIFKKTAVKYHDVWKKFLKTTLRRCPFFKTLPAKVLSEIIYLLPTSRVEPNMYIYKEGEKADKITFVIDGRVEIYTPVNDARLLLLPNNEKIAREHTAFSNRIRFHRNSLASIKKKKDMRYIVKIAMDELGMGSVICPNLTLFEGKVNIYAKATQLTVIMTLSAELLKVLCKTSPEIREAVETYKSKMYVEDRLSRVKRVYITALDYEKCFVASPAEESEHLWQTKMKMKRCVMGKILEKRVIRAKGFTDLLSMSHKLKAILDAEEVNDFEMVEKIRRGIMPKASFNIAKAYSLLSLSEVENPILTQFALESTKVGLSIDDIKERMIKVLEEMQKVKKKRVKIIGQMVKAQKLLDIYARLTTQ